MRILGLVASYRKMGNSEVLAREALLAARELGAEVALIRLTDLHVEPCKGCMACLFKGEPCRIEDDVDWFMNQLLESDGVVLSSPTYILSPPGIVKMLIDRMIPLQDSDKIRELAERRRVGVAIGVA
ncbi:flavodoxin family protein, partial [archaeon]